MKITISKKDLVILIKVLDEYFNDNLAWECQDMWDEKPFIPYEKETELRFIEKFKIKHQKVIKKAEREFYLKIFKPKGGE